MPLYTVVTQVNVLDQAGKAALADGITSLHAEMSSVPRNWIHIVFQEYPAGNGFTAGELAATAALTVLIRAGRSSDYKREMLTRLWALLQRATGAPDEQIVIGIQEVPPSQAMEMGQIMPEVADE
jgi:phenylpyruvate tautomerase PptA (4-oxalocrotonate tautomerase family)